MRHLPKSALRFVLRLFSALLLLIAAFYALVYLSGRVAFWRAEKRALDDFQKHRQALTELAENWAEYADRSPMEAVLSPLVHGTVPCRVPDELASIGIESISVWDDDVIECTYADRISLIFAFGFLRTEEPDRLDGWYAIKPLEDNWYYYHTTD